ncbi:MAG: transposase [Candidatus Delongbacteria bacterium]|jgi:tetratricopeptide (TPR) repeat protein|nr:transposase [Candidatus Delongbacteria bacterium]
MEEKQLKYPPEFKMEVAGLALKSGVTSASVKHDLHRSTVNNWLSRYRKNGFNGFTVTRNDTQAVKLDRTTIDKIYNFKKSNPKATLNDIKNHFGLDCHISLVGRKLNKFDGKNSSRVANDHSLLIPVLNKANRKFLHESLNEIKNSGDVSFNLHDYSSALAEYKKVYKVLSSTEYFSDKLMIDVLYSKSKVYFMKGDDQTALLLLRDALKNSVNEYNYLEKAKCRMLLGSIFVKFHDINKVEKNYSAVKKILKGKSDVLSLYFYYRAEYTLKILTKDYDQASEVSILYIYYAYKTKDYEIIGNMLGGAFIHLYYTGRYEEYAKTLYKSKHYNLKNNSSYNVSMNILDLLNVHGYGIIWNESEIWDLRKELLKYSTKLKCSSLVPKSDYSIGIKYYRKGKYEEALKFFEKSYNYIKYCGSIELFLSCLYYYGIALLKIGELSKSLRKVNLLHRESLKVKNDEYIYLSIQSLTVIYLRKCNLKQAVRFCKKTIQTAYQRKDFYILGKFYYYLGVLKQKQSNTPKTDYYFSESIKFYQLFKEKTGKDVSRDIEVVNVSKSSGIDEYNDICKILTHNIVQNKYINTHTRFFFYFLLLDLL